MRETLTFKIGGRFEPKPSFPRDLSSAARDVTVVIRTNETNQTRSKNDTCLTVAWIEVFAGRLMDVFHRKTDFAFGFIDRHHFYVHVAADAHDAVDVLDTMIRLCCFACVNSRQTTVSITDYQL